MAAHKEIKKRELSARAFAFGVGFYEVCGCFGGLATVEKKKWWGR